MKNKLLFILVLSTIVAFGFFAKVAYAGIIDTIDISRITPPRPPTPPTKPEPPSPPTVPPMFTPRPTLTPKPSVNPTATPSEGSPSCGEGEHLDASGKNCVRFGDAGSGSSGVGGQVLGASTMAGTGMVEEAIFNLIFILGSGLTALGLRKFRSTI